jgi:hypothetical protein
MKLLIDATAIPQKPVGAGIYISRLVRELLLVNQEFDITILAHKDDYDLFNLQDEYKKNFIFQIDRGKGFRILSEQIIFPSLIKKNKIDLYHGLHYTTPINKKTCTITTIHDTTFFLFPKKHTWLKRLYFKFFIKHSCFNSDHLITVSDNTKKDLIDLLNIDSKKITTTHLGVDDTFKPIVDVDKFEYIKFKYQLPDRFILYVGLIEPRKNLSSLVRAFSRYLTNLELPQDVHLIIAGRWGWESKELLTLVSELNISQKVHFPGYIDQNDLPFLYNMAKVFVYPSYYEGFGLPVLEAMACGTPVITSNVSSMPEFVGNGGILINPNDIDSLVDALRNTLTNNNLRNELSSNALIQSGKYSWKETARKTLAVYHRVLMGE